VLKRHSQEEIESAFRWFIANRDSKEIPLRLDFILDAFPDYVAKGKKDYR